MASGLVYENPLLHAGESADQLEKDASSRGELVEVSGTSYQVTDTLTTVPVTITLGKFLIAPGELTQGEFEAVMGYNPSFHKGADRPVETVSWWEAIHYCNLRSQRENFESCYNLETGFCDVSNNGYRLPTDAEWTHAAGPVPEMTGNSLAANLGNSDTKHIGRLVEELKDSGTKPAGSYPANAFGLYNMYGNVWEWTTDYTNPERTPQASYNPSGPLRGLGRIVRGGSYVSATSVPWAQDYGSYRSSIEPDYKTASRASAFAARLHRNPSCRQQSTRQTGSKHLTMLRLDMSRRLASSPRWLARPALYSNGKRTAKRSRPNGSSCSAQWKSLLHRPKRG